MKQHTAKKVLSQTLLLRHCTCNWVQTSLQARCSTPKSLRFAIGINATIAYFLGAQKQNTADKAASLGTLFNMIHGLILAVVCIAITAPFLAMFTDKRSIIDMGAAYAQIVFLFAVPNAAGLCFEKIFQSVGRMKTSMLCMLIGCVTNIILDPFMIFVTIPISS